MPFVKVMMISTSPLTGAQDLYLYPAFQCTSDDCIWWHDIEAEPFSLTHGSTRSQYKKKFTTKLISSLIDAASYSASETHRSCLRRMCHA